MTLPANPQNTKTLANMIYACGFAFTVLGTLCLAFPQWLDGIFEREQVRIVAGVFIVLGISDFFIARFLFDKVKTK